MLILKSINIGHRPAQRGKYCASISAKNVHIGPSLFRTHRRVLVCTQALLSKPWRVLKRYVSHDHQGFSMFIICLHTCTQTTSTLSVGVIEGNTLEVQRNRSQCQEKEHVIKPICHNIIIIIIIT